jgi:hypothetical protein
VFIVSISESLTSARPQMNLWIMGPSVSFQFRHEQFFASSRKSRDCAEAYIGYVAQAISQIDAEIAEKGHFWMETNYPNKAHSVFMPSAFSSGGKGSG